MALSPDSMWIIILFLLGAIIGSFLNVVIWRMPRSQNLSLPPSHCPYCNTAIPFCWNIPLVSFLLLRAKCKWCQKPISWRYFGVELLTAVLFALIGWKFGVTYQAAAYSLLTAAMIAAFFIDLELFIIPDQLNTFGLIVGILADAIGTYTHNPAHALLWGWMPRSILGAMACAGVFFMIQALGLALFRKEAMGDGDVKLARAIGAVLPIGLAMLSFFFAVCAGAVIGIGIAIFVKKPAEEYIEDDSSEEIYEGPGYPWWSSGAYILFLDLIANALAKMKVPGAEKWHHFFSGEPELLDEADDWKPGPTHIPFGPFMVMGALASMFFGEPFLRWYLYFVGLQ
ncbi:MAG: prepilin peptidase [Chthonomonadales bacterium]